MKRLCGLLAALLLQPTAWSAEPAVKVYRDAPRSYVGVNLAHAIVEFDSVDEDVTLSALNARLGAMTSDHFGLETRFGFGGDNHTLRAENGSGDKLDQTIDHIGALYLTGRGGLLNLPYDLGRIYTQGYLGVGTAQIKNERRRCTAAGVCSSDTERNDETGFSWGVALGVQPRPEISLALEYMQYFSADEVDLNTIEAGIMYHF